LRELQTRWSYFEIDLLNASNNLPDADIIARETIGAGTWKAFFLIDQQRGAILEQFLEIMEDVQPFITKVRTTEPRPSTIMLLCSHHQIGGFRRRFI